MPMSTSDCATVLSCSDLRTENLILSQLFSYVCPEAVLAATERRTRGTKNALEIRRGRIEMVDGSPVRVGARL